MTEKSNLPNALLQCVPWEKNPNPIWPASSFFLYRNLDRYRFAGQLDETESLRVLDILKKPLLQLSKLKNPLYFSAESLTAQEKDFLCEHFLSQDGWQNAVKGQAFILDESCHFLAVLNFRDHLLLQWVDCKNEWEKAWNALNQIELAIGEHLDYAFSSQFGYLTSNARLCGTGLLVVCYLHLPSLISSGQLQELLSSHKEDSVEATGMQGDLQELVGDFLILKNRYTLGLTEESILRDLHMTATKLVLSEQTQRLQYKKTSPPDLKDRISRAYGLLMHSYQLETKEALSAISQIKLGIDLGWVQGMTDDEINEIFFRCRRAHLLQTQEKISLDKKELAHTRAEYLNQKLRQTTLSF